MIKDEFVRAALLIGLALGLVWTAVGFMYEWNFAALGPVGDYFGGIANAAVLTLVCYGIYFQSKEYKASIEEFKSQAHSAKASVWLQHFNLLTRSIDETIGRISYEETGPQGVQTFYGVNAVRKAHDLVRAPSFVPGKNDKILLMNGAVNFFCSLFMSTYEFISQVEKEQGVAFKSILFALYYETVTDLSYIQWKCKDPKVFPLLNDVAALFDKDLV